MVLFNAAFVAQAQEPKQVNVAVKIIEFQATNDLETGLSAYFKNRLEPRPYGHVVAGQESAVDSVALTFPNSNTTGLTVFLNNIANNWADVELVLQALVDQGKAFILSQPKVMVPVAAPVPAIIKTSQDVPYANTIVIGASAVQTTAFKPTGVAMTVSALEVIDDDGNPATTEDTYIKLKLTAEINEEGPRIAVALGMGTGSGNVLNQTTTAITVPEFVSRSVDTTVWVRNGQVLLMGGLYRNNKIGNLSTMPWFPQTEGVLNNLISRVLPFAANPQVPLSASVGNNSKSQDRRELVFMIKADLWRKSYTVADEFGFASDQPQGEKKEGEEKAPEEPVKSKTPADVISGVLGNGGGMAPGLAGSIGVRPGNAALGIGGKSK